MMKKINGSKIAAYAIVAAAFAVSISISMGISFTFLSFMLNISAIYDIFNQAGGFGFAIIVAIILAIFLIPFMLMVKDAIINYVLFIVEKMMLKKKR